MLCIDKNSWWQLYLHEDTLQNSKVNFSNQGLLTECGHIVNWFPLVPLFVMGLIVLVCDHSKRFPLDYHWGNKKIEFEKTNNWLIFDWYPSESGLVRNQKGSLWGEVFTSGIKWSCLNNVNEHGDACQGNATIWMWLKSIIFVWCFGRLGLQRRYRGFGPPSPD